MKKNTNGKLFMRRKNCADEYSMKNLQVKTPFGKKLFNNIIYRNKSLQKKTYTWKSFFHTKVHWRKFLNLEIL